MTQGKSFVYTDSRTFLHVGTVPHTTRDHREITLQVWRTNCLHPGCPEVLDVRTATPEPQCWAAFTPKKYCKRHLHLARLRAGTAAKKAHKAWMESNEGKLALANRTGPTATAVLRAISGLSILDGFAKVADVALEVIQGMKPPDTGKRDTRGVRVDRTILTLILKDKIYCAEGDKLYLGPRPKLPQKSV
jgi:hypothetical protein